MGRLPLNDMLTLIPLTPPKNDIYFITGPKEGGVKRERGRRSSKGENVLDRFIFSLFHDNVPWKGWLKPGKMVGEGSNDLSSHMDIKSGKVKTVQRTFHVEE